MLIRSLIAVVLSIPATFAIVGLVLVLTPQTTNIILPVLLFGLSSLGDTDGLQLSYC